jgi:hypothetical protein
MPTLVSFSADAGVTLDNCLVADCRTSREIA